MKAFQHLLTELGKQLQIGPLTLDNDGYVQLCFEKDLIVMIKIEENPPILTLFSIVGEAPNNNPDFAEELLSSNLFWRDTSGATLSLERYSRTVMLAKQFSSSNFQDYSVFESEMHSFVDCCEKWKMLIPQLSLPEVSETLSQDALEVLAAR